VRSVFRSRRSPVGLVPASSAPWVRTTAAHHQVRPRQSSRDPGSRTWFV